MTKPQEFYRECLQKQYVGDQQGFLYAELGAMLKGYLPLRITDDHEKALNSEMLSRFNISNIRLQEAF